MRNGVWTTFGLLSVFASSMARADTEMVGGYTWYYRITNGSAEIYNPSDVGAISPHPTGALTIPSTLGGYTVTRIGENAFIECTGLTNVTIPDRVTSIGSAAFLGCSSLVSIDIPDRVTTIGADVFSGCSSLASVSIPASVTSIGAYAFIDCISLTSFSVSYYNDDFSSKNGLLLDKSETVLIAGVNGTVVIPNGVTRIGNYAFYGLSGLSSVTIPDGVTRIGRSAFEYCNGLTAVAIPSSVKVIEYDAFRNCDNLSSVTLQNCTTQVYGTSAFPDDADVVKIHQEEVVKQRKEPTCTENGWTRQVSCNRCHDILETSTPIPALGHAEVETKASKPPTCTEAGWTHEVSCSRCNAVLEPSTAISALGGDHAGVETKTARAPTCTESGWTRELTCSRCNAVLEASSAISPLGHSGSETKTAQSPTCTAAGWTHEVTCTRCHSVLEASTAISALGHAGVQTKAAKVATCTAAGWTREMTCSRCHAVLETSSELPALGHAGTETKAAKAPTCTEPGWTHETKCSRCGTTLESSQGISALGHSGAVTKPAVEPTSGEAGKTDEIACVRCGAVLQQQRTIPALGYVRNVTARQIWPHKKVEVRYELAPDIGDKAPAGTALALTGKYGSTTKTASTKRGDASCTPGCHVVAWDMEADGIAVNQSSMTFTAAYSSVNGTSAGTAVNTSSSVKDGMIVSGMVSLGYSPFGDGEATLLIDGATALSSTNSGSFAWMPRTTGTHTLQHISGSCTWTRTVNVTDIAYYVEPQPNPPTSPDENISISSTSKSFGTGGGSGSVVTSGSGTWTATVSADWITIPEAFTSRNAGLPVVYQVAANAGVESRTGYIYVSGHVFMVTQAGVGASLDRTSASFETDGGTGSFTVLAGSQSSWRVKSNVDWISVAATTGSGEAEVSFTVAPFNEVSTRSGTITAAGCSFTVNQTGRRMKIYVPDAQSSAPPVVDRDYQSHAIDIQVNALSSTTWDVEPDSSWISVVDAGSGHGGDNVAIAINENPSWLARSGSVRIGTETLGIRQSGRPSAALAFSISPESTTASVKGANGLISVFATPDLPWTVQSQANWLTVMPAFQTGAGNGNVVYTASPNTTMAVRTGMVTVFATPDASLPQKTHTVTQPAATASVSSTSHVFAPAGGSFGVDVAVHGEVNWTVVVGNDGWISIGGGTNRIGSGTVTISAVENLTIESRSANLTIAGHPFVATQKGRSVQVEYESKVFDTDGGYDTLDIHPDGNVRWTAVSSAPDWLTIWGGEGCTYDQDGNVVGTGDNTLEFIVSEYVGDGSPRTATITIGDKTVFITQRAYDLSIDPSATWVSGNAGSGSVGVPATAGQLWNAIATEPWITIASGYDSGTGNGTVLFTYTDNDTGEERTGRIVVAGEIYTITQAARQMATVSARVEGGKGLVSGTGTYDRGTSVTLSAVANDGCEFLNWTLPNGTTRTGASLSVTADVDKEIVANFRRIPYYDVNGESVREGASKTFTAPADILDAAGTTKLVCRGTSAYPALGTSFTLVVTEDISFEWDLWTTNYLVSVSQSSGGTIRKGGSQASATSWVAAGASLTLTAAPGSGKSLFRWNVESGSPGGLAPPDAANANAAGTPLATLTLCVDRPLAVSAVFGVFDDTLAEALDAPALVFATGGDAAWTPVVDATAQTGYTSARAGAVGADADTWLDLTLEGAGMLTFRWRVDCEKDDGGDATWDRLAVFANGVEISRIDGKTDWQTVTIPVTGSKTTIRWSFYRDDFDEPGQTHENAGWVDGIYWTPN